MIVLPCSCFQLKLAVAGAAVAGAAVAGAAVDGAAVDGAAVDGAAVAGAIVVAGVAVVPQADSTVDKMTVRVTIKVKIRLFITPPNHQLLELDYGDL